MNDKKTNFVNEKINVNQARKQTKEMSNISNQNAAYKNYKKSNQISKNNRMFEELNNKKQNNNFNNMEFKKKQHENSLNKAKHSSLKGMVANKIVSSKTGNKALGDLAERAANFIDNLSPFGAAKNAILNRTDDLESDLDEFGNPKQHENKLENVSFEIPQNIKKWGLIIGIPSITVLLIIALLLPASQTYINVFGFGSADDVTENELKDIDDSWYESGKGSTELENVEAFYYESKTYLTDNFIQLEKENNKENISLVARKNNEADITQINDYFSDKLTCTDNDCENEPEYLFYLKMHDIYYLYYKKYNVKLDLPLLMSTLSIADEELPNVFIYNSKGYSKEKHEKYFDYIDENSEEILDIDPNYDYKNIDNYIYLSTEDFSYDMQILAQNMVVKDGENFRLDLDHYKEFLQKYIEYKYYISDSEKKKLLESEEEIQQDNSSQSTDVGDWTTWKQCNPKWANIKIKGTNTTVCSIGCFITSHGILIYKSGTEVKQNFNPGTLARQLNFSNGNYVSGFEKIAPNFVAKSRIYVSGLNKTQIYNKLKKYSKDKYYFMLRVGLKTRSGPHHFVAVNYIDDKTKKIYIYDSSKRNIKMVYDAYKIYEIRVFERKD